MRRQGKEMYEKMSECTHDCSSCGESCAERTGPQDFMQQLRLGLIPGEE